MQRHVAAVVLAATLAWTPRAFAQDAVTSEALFQKGVDDVAAGRFDTGCPAMAESLRLDPRPGTLFTLAECYAKAGKVASAVVRFEEYLVLFSRMTPEQQSKQLGREKSAAEQRDLLKPDVPLLLIELETGAPADTLVKRDDTVLNGPSLGVALPIDPGEHTISAQAPNGPLTTQTLTIGKGERKQVSLKVEVTTTTTMSTTSTTGGAAAPATPPATTSEPAGDSQRLVAFVVGSAGAASLLTGVVAGSIALASKSSIEDQCDFDAQRCATQSGLDDVSSARTAGTVSTIGLTIGGILLGTAAVLFFSAPSPSDDAPARSAAAAPRLSLGFTPFGGSAALIGELP